MDLKDHLEAYRKTHGLHWEELFDMIEDETGLPCPHGTWMNWLYGKGFSKAAYGVISKWLDRVESEDQGESAHA